MAGDFSISLDKKGNYAVANENCNTDTAVTTTVNETIATTNDNFRTWNEADGRLAAALTGTDNTEPQQAEVVKPLKARELDYSLFSKSQMKDANKLAERSLNEVKDLTRDFNADFPAKPYVPNYEEFPKPEEFKQFKNKDDRYDAWSDAVVEWVEDCKQDMKTQRSTNLSDMASLFEAKIDRNLIVSCAQFDITRETMLKLFEQAQGDMQKFNESIRSAINRAARQIESEVINQGNAVRKDIDYSTEILKEAVGDKAEEVGRKVDGVGRKVDDVGRKVNGVDGKVDKVGRNVDKVNEKLDIEEQKETLRKEIFIGLHNAPKPVFRKIRNYLNDKGYRFDNNAWEKILRAPLMQPGETPIRENNPLSGVIENLNLEELQEIREIIKVKIISDPYVH